MANRQRYLLIGLFVGLLLLSGLVFQSFVLAEIIVPLATVLWLLLRISVLSIDQHVYWWALIGLAAIVVVTRLLRETGPLEAEHLPEPNPVHEQVLRWYSAITNNVYDTEESNRLKRSLLWLLVSLYAPRGRSFASLETEHALRERRIPVPEGIYNFLMLPEPVLPRVNFFRRPARYAWVRLRAGQMRLQRWQRRVTGRTAAEYYQAIDETLALMESALEIKHDDESRDAADH